MRYRELFTVEVLHDYFADGKARTMLFTPTPACLVILKSNGLVIKFLDNKLYVLAQTPDGLKPLRDLPKPGVFSFYIQPADADFFQYSNLPLKGNSTNRYYFSNRENALADGKIYLHALNPTFDNAIAHAVGEFVRSGTGNCYECLVNLAPDASTLTNKEQWRNLGKVAYATASHHRTFTGPVMNVPVVPAAKTVTVNVFGLDESTMQLDRLQYANTWVYEAETEPVASQQVSLAGLSAGIYRVNVNGVDHSVCYSPDNHWPGQVGLIEVFTHDTTPADYRLLDGAGQFRSPAFSIRMAAVSSLWQYVARTEGVKNIFDQTANGIEFEQVAPFTFRSKLPLRLQEKPYDKLAMDYNNSDPPDPTRKVEITKLSVPGYRNQRTTRKDNTDYLVSELYLNY